jgi:hypothetical protein
VSWRATDVPRGRWSASARIGAGVLARRRSIGSRAARRGSSAGARAALAANPASPWLAARLARASRRELRALAHAEGAR